MTKRSIYIFYIPTTRLEADKMVDALNRLDQTDALVEQILGDRAKLEHHANRGPCASKQPRAGVSDGSSNYHVIRV